MYFDMLRSRRSIRKFKDNAIEKETVEALLKSALLSPSSRAIRPWEFIAVTDKALLNKLSGCREHSAAFLSGAPLGIVVIADSSKSDVWVEDASIASVLIQLTAHEMGLGSCWVQVRNRLYNDQKSAEAYIKELLGIPEKYCVESVIAVGYPDETKRPYSDTDLLYDKIHYNRY